MKPSPGVIAIGVLSIVVGVIWGLASTYLLIFLIVEGVNLSEAGSYLGFGMLTLPIDLILAMILIISGIGVFLLKRWARALGLIYASATLILEIIGLIITVLQGAHIWSYGPHYPIAGMIIDLFFETIGYATPIVLLILFQGEALKNNL